MSVIILGSGVDGLLAAHTARQRGHEITILSASNWQVKQPIHGMQYLHSPVAGIANKGSIVHYSSRGTLTEYRKKVFGRKRIAGDNTPLYSGPKKVYDIHHVYDTLLSIYKDSIKDWQITGANLQELQASGSLIISTIMADHLCQEDHQFPTYSIWSVEDNLQRGISAPTYAVPGTVLCNALPGPRYYRASNLFGHRTVEWPDGEKPPVEGVQSHMIPINTNCMCHPWLARAGRLGEWRQSRKPSEVIEIVNSLISRAEKE